jgi:single-strand DNA-binding protein
MSIGDTTLTVIGNLTKDPELKWLPSGVAVVSFTIASSRRVRDNDSGEWKDGDTIFMHCSAWRHIAEHIGDSLTQGMRVVAHGRLKQRDYEVEGDRRTIMELDVEEIGPSLKYATAKVIKAARSGAPVPHPADTHASTSSSGWGKTQPGPDDPWAGAASTTEDEPPF